MSEHTTTAPADSGQQAAPPPKPKRPKPKSMLMIGEHPPPFYTRYTTFWSES